MAESAADVKTQVRSFIVTNFFFGSAPDSLTDSASFLENGIIDSTGILEVIGFIHQTFGFEVLDSEMLPQNLDSLNNIAAYVSRKKAA